MTTRTLVCNGLIVLAMNGVASPQVAAQGPSITAFVDVNVVPMDTERVLEHQTVIVNGDRITAVGPTDDTAVPEGATTIQGRGGYLMPGIADMHTHLTFDADPRSLILYLAQGITTVRNLNAIPEHLEWRKLVAEGDLVGPTIYTSGNAIGGLPAEYGWLPLVARGGTLLAPVVIGILVWMMIWLASRYSSWVGDLGRKRRLVLPSLAGLLLVGGVLAWSMPLTSYVHMISSSSSVPQSEGEARRLVRNQHAQRVDLVKLYDFLPMDIFVAALDEARRLGLYASGHIPDGPDITGLEDLFEAGLEEVVHVDEFSHEFWPDYDPAAEGWVEYRIDMNRIDDVAASVATHDVAVTLTLITDEAVLLGLEDVDDLLRRPAYRVVRPEVLESWRTGGRFVNWKGQETYRRKEWRPLLLALTKALYDHGVHLNLGSDVSVEGIVPGYSTLLELALLVEAGLTPFEALSIGTRNPSETASRMGAGGDWGTVVEGNRADLVLLPRNPLDDVRHTQNRLGVMVRGRWFPQAELDALVDELVGTYATE